MLDVSALPDDAEVLKDIVSTLSIKQKKYEFELQERDRKICERDKEIELLRELNRLLRLAKYATSQSEKDKRQVEFFNEAELGSDIEEKAKNLKAVQGYTRSKPKRKPLPEHLPREEVVIELSADECRCSCGCDLKEIGSDTSEKLDMVPATLKVIRTIRKKYACSKCDCIKRAPLPLSPIPKSNATPGLLASIVVSKYADSLPLYRQEQIFARQGIDLPRSTTSNWMLKCGELITPLINLFWDELLEDTYLQIDETRVQVLKEPGKKPTSQSWMWTTARAGPKPIVIFEYDPTRKKNVPNRLLEGFAGYLQCDGYASYDEFCGKAEVTRVGCGYHIRRKFFEASKATQGKRRNLSLEVVDLFKPLFKIEEIARENHLSPEARYAFRQEKAMPIIAEIKLWLDMYADKVLPKGKLGKAIGYARNEWSNFIRYLEDGRLEIGTIYVENTIRPFAVGRRNWLFCDTVKGAQASAALYSIVQTAKANGLNPFHYMKFVFDKLPAANSIDDYEALLPWHCKNALA